MVFARIGVLQDGVATGSVCGAFVSVWMRLRIAVTASMGGVGVAEPSRPQAASIHDELLALFLDASCCAVRRAFILLPSCSPNLLTEDSLETDRVASRSPPTAACSARTFSSVGGSPLKSCEKVIFSSMFGDAVDEGMTGSSTERWYCGTVLNVMELQVGDLRRLARMIFVAK